MQFIGTNKRICLMIDGQWLIAVINDASFFLSGLRCFTGFKCSIWILFTNDPKVDISLQIVGFQKGLFPQFTRLEPFAWFFNGVATRPHGAKLSIKRGKVVSIEESLVARQTIMLH